MHEGRLRQWDSAYNSLSSGPATRARGSSLDFIGQGVLAMGAGSVSEAVRVKTEVGEMDGLR